MSSQVVQVLEFGQFRIDAVRRVLYRDGSVVEIPPKAFAVLLALVERRGQIVGKQELMDAVWPNTAVEENNLARSISTLRKALGEKSGEHRYILTMPGNGYSFVGVEAAGETVNGSDSQGQRRGFQLPIKRPVQGIAALAALSIAVLWISGQARPVGRSEQVVLKRILSSQTYPSAALSPDGKLVVYAAGAAEQESIRLRLIESGKEAELLPASGRSYSGFTFAPDGRHVFFVATPATGKANVLVRLPLSGGPATEVARELDSPAAVSPDGSRLAFVREAQGESVLVEHRLADGKEDRLAATKLPVFLDYPTWSPDGRSIAYTQVTTDGVFLQELLMESRRQRRVGQRWQYLRRFSWRARSDGFLVSAIEPGADGFTLWQVARANGAASRLTENVESLHSVVASADGTRALTVAERSLAAVSVGTPGGSEDWRQLSPASENVAAVSWTDAGILLERSTASGQSVHLVSPDGMKQEELLPPGPHSNVRLCLDQRKLVYYSALPDRAGLWITDVRGGSSSRLVALAGETVADCTTKEHAISFVSRDPRWWPGLWSIPIDGGEPRRIDQRAGIRYAISPDGRYAAYFDQEGVASPQKQVTQIVVDSLDGSGSVKRFELPPGLARGAPLRWMPGETVITYAHDRGGGAEIWGQNLSGGPPRQTTNLSGGTIKSFDWSPDGKQLVVSRGMQSFELLVLELGR